MTETKAAPTGSNTTSNPSLRRPEDLTGLLADDDSTYKSIVKSAACDAMDVSLMQIESSFTRGFAGMQLLGNTTEICRDGKERAKAALESLGIHIPPKRLVVSLTPADIKKDGNHFDLPIAVSLALLLLERPAVIDASSWLFAAELGLSGELRPIKGAVSFAIAAMAAGLAGLVVAPENLEEISALRELSGAPVRPMQAVGFRTLKELLAWLFDGDESGCIMLPRERRFPATGSSCLQPNYDDMIMHPLLETAALVAATGMHSMLLRGSPGTGKSMFAARLTCLLPVMEHAEHIDAMRIYSHFSEKLPLSLLRGRPPFRAPHHQASASAVLGTPDTPGELALAHGGVLFLDELPEFRRDLLESLREPLETGEVRVSRTKRKVTWRARVMLVAACNNCPCGWSGSSRRLCDCSQTKLHSYRQRLSGPLLDRIDMHINVPEVSGSSADLFIKLSHAKAQSQTERMALRVSKARSFAAQRNRQFGVLINSDLAAQHFLAASGLEANVFEALLNTYVPKSASSRSVIRCLRVARTLADLDESAAIRPEDLEQAWRWQAERSAQERGEWIKFV